MRGFVSTYEDTRNRSERPRVPPEIGTAVRVPPIPPPGETLCLRMRCRLTHNPPPTPFQVCRDEYRTHGQRCRLGPGQAPEAENDSSQLQSLHQALCGSGEATAAADEASIAAAALVAALVATAAAMAIARLEAEAPHLKKAAAEVLGAWVGGCSDSDGGGDRGRRCRGEGPEETEGGQRQEEEEGE